ncbi:alpha/beta fold hydrolase [Kribbella sp. NPDC023972]|uniref:alpha/beta fold hydrolase n=1 Tax=Kribbella sp. NPDC023972 TaxID=3154795 RepID=UPI0033E34A90
MIADVELAYRHMPGDGTCVVFISGLGEPGAVWAPVIDRLPARTSTFTYDRAGCGHSGPVPAGGDDEARPVQWGAEQLLMLLDTVGVPGPWVLVGHSIGGLIADSLARCRTEQVAGMVLIDTSDPAFDTRIDSPRPILVDGRDGEGWRISMPATLEGFNPGPDNPVETVVIGSAIWRWLRVDDPAPYLPLTLLEADQHWHRHQLDLAKRWAGHLVVPHTAGHRVHEEAPDLVALATQAVVEAAAAGRPVRLDQEALVRSGGTVRIDAKGGTFTEWDSTGRRDI